MEEEFKVIKGFENYSISNLGNVANMKTAKIKKPRINTSGYYIIDIRNNGKTATKYIHRLVAQEFIPNPTNKPCVDHIDNNPLNNNANNLRWCSNSENQMNRAISSNNTSGIKGVSFHNNLNKWVAKITLNGKKHYIGYYDTLDEAKEARKNKANELFGQFVNKCEKIKTELEELQELEKELEELMK